MTCAGFELPNYTQIPNTFLDYWMPIISPYETVIVNFLCRKIFGFHKHSDKVSIAQICKGTGQARSSVVKYIKSLIARGLVLRYKSKTDKGDDDTNLFALKLIIPEEGSASDVLPVVRDTDPGVVRGADTQKKTYTKEKTTKQTATPGAAVYDCLKEEKIPQADKIRLSTYPEPDVIAAVAYAHHKDTIIKTSLVQVLYWAVKDKPPIPPDKEKLSKENKPYAMAMEAKVPKTSTATVVAGNDKVEILFPSCGYKAPVYIDYDRPNFREEFHQALFNHGLECLYRDGVNIAPKRL